LGWRSTGLSVGGDRVLGVPGRDIGVDATSIERFEIGFAAVAGIGRGLLGLGPRLFSMASISGIN
jgi:hypothetical protein